VTHRQKGSSFDDTPYRRMRRDDNNVLVEISDREWVEGSWYDVTSLDDPCDVHVFVAMWIKR
jgi:hypothetical protein